MKMTVQNKVWINKKNKINPRIFLQRCHWLWSKKLSKHDMYRKVKSLWEISFSARRKYGEKKMREGNFSLFGQTWRVISLPWIQNVMKKWVWPHWRGVESCWGGEAWGGEACSVWLETDVWAGLWLWLFPQGSSPGSRTGSLTAVETPEQK